MKVSCPFRHRKCVGTKCAIFVEYEDGGECAVSFAAKEINVATEAMLRLAAREDMEAGDKDEPKNA